MRRLFIGGAVLVFLALFLFSRWLGSALDSGQIERILTARLSEVSGFTVQLSQPLDFEWLPAPGLVVNGLSLVNPSFDSKTSLVSVEQLRIRIDLLGSLFQRQVVLGELALSRVNVFLIRDAKGQGNWSLEPVNPVPAAEDSTQEGDSDLLGRVADLKVDFLSLQYRDEITAREVKLDLKSLYVSRPEGKAPGQANLKGDLNGHPLLIQGTYSLPETTQASQGGSPSAGLKVAFTGSFSGKALQGDLKGFTGLPSDFSKTSLEVTLKSDEPAFLAQEVGEPEAEKWAKEAGAVDFAGQLVGRGPDGLSLKAGRLELGSDKNLSLSMSGDIEDLINGAGVESQIAVETHGVNRIFALMGVELPPVGNVSAKASLRGTLTVPKLEDIEVEAVLKTGVKLGMKGELKYENSETNATLALSLVSKRIEPIVSALEETPGGLGKNVSSILSMTRERALAHRVLALGPVAVTATVRGSADGWGLVNLKGEAGPEKNQFIRVSGKAPEIWPAPRGLDFRLESRIQNSNSSAKEVASPFDQFEAVELSGTWRGQSGNEAGIEDIVLKLNGVDGISLVAQGSARLKGSQFVGTQGQITLEAKSLDVFDGVAGRALPAWAPVRVASRFEGDSVSLSLKDVSLELGKTQLTGSGGWLYAQKIPLFKVRLHTNRFDLVDTALAIREEGKAKVKGSGTQGQSATSDAPLDFGWLQTTQADFEFTADQVILGKGWMGEKFQLSLDWAKGVLNGPRLDLTWEGGGAQVLGRLDAAGQVPSFAMGLSTKGMDVSAMAGWFGQAHAISGRAEWAMDLKTSGSSKKELLAGLDGGALLYVQHGSVLDRYADALQLGLGSLSRGGQQPMNCLILALKSEKGVVHTEGLLWDTPIKLVRGVGVANLKTDHLDLLLRPHLKRAIATSITAAIRIEGPIENLSVRPEPFQTATDLARGLIGRTLRAVRAVSPQVANVVVGVGSTTDSMMASTGLNAPSVLSFLAKPETCESVLARPSVAELRGFKPSPASLK